MHILTRTLLPAHARHRRAFGALLLCLAAVFAPGARADDIRQVALSTNDLTYDPGTQQIYASVPSSAGSSGNSITPINPVTATVGTSVFVGSEPGMLARSDDDQFLYVALTGSSSVRRFTLATKTAGLTFSIGSPYQVEDMAVPPGQPNSICVVQEDPRYSPHFAGTVIYDDGIARPHSSNGQDTIAFSASAGRLYAYDNSISEFDFDRLNISATGFDVPGGDQNDSLISGYGLHIKFSDGLVFVNNGEVIDPEAETILGTFSGTGYNVPFAIQPGDGRAFFLTGSGSTLTLCAYDTTTFLPTGTLSIPGVSGSAGSLIRWGSNGLAFRTSGGQVFLIRTSLVPNQATSTPVAVSTGSDGDTRLLWNRSDGVAAVWKVDAAGNLISQQQFGPYAGWTAKAIATGQDNRTRLLWTNTSGAVSYYLLDANNAFVTQQQYGPYTGWTAQGLAVETDNTVRALWTNADGTATVWTMDSTNSLTGQQQYGPYAGWTALSLAVNPDGTERLLWDNANGTATFWKLSSTSQLIDQHQYGPYTGYTAGSIAAAPDGTGRVVWTATDAHIALWTIDGDNLYTGQNQYGPYTGWSFTGIGVGSDGNARLLWNNVTRQAALWSLTPGGDFATNYQFGPY
jgi:hypothetical protein